MRREREIGRETERSKRATSKNKTEGEKIGVVVDEKGKE